MIPKIIHYCWFGHGEMSPMMKKCIQSWKKFCPDFEIVEWNEDNFDINSSIWTKQAYEAKKYAFVSDYVRLKVLYEYGGIYMDTDQELIKPLTPYLEHDAFLGFMDDMNITSGLIGSMEEHPAFAKFLEYYRDRPFLKDGKEDIAPNTNYMTDYLVADGLVVDDTYQVVNGIHIYPRTYFCPTSCVSIEDCRSNDTVALHHWAMTWRTDKAKKDFARVKRHQRKWYRTWEWLRYLPNRVVRSVFGDEAIDKLKARLSK